MLTLYIADAERDVSMKNLSRKEAAKILEDMKVKIEIPKAAVTQWKRNIALDMAVESLSCSEFPNSSDAISRQAAKEAYCKHFCHRGAACPDTLCKEVNEAFDELPSAQPEPLTESEVIICKMFLECKAIGSESCNEYKLIMDLLDGKRSAQPEPYCDEWCDDCKEYDKEQHCCPRWNRVIRQALKDAQPEPHEGYWIPREGIDGDIQYECSKCGVLWEFNYGTPEDNEAYFCPKCGTKIKGVRHEGD